MLGAVFLWHVSIILISGFFAGCLCKRYKISPLIGYLLIGALIGPGGFDLLGKNSLENNLALMEQEREIDEERRALFDKFAKESTLEEVALPFEQTLLSEKEAFQHNDSNDDLQETDELKEGVEKTILAEENKENGDANVRMKEYIEAKEEIETVMEGVTEFGVLLLLFAIGIEFTFDKLAATAKYMFVGGILQMGVTILLSIVIWMGTTHMSWAGGLALGSVVALSSTALVYRSMADVGKADAKRTQATLGLLIFQDIALVPLLLILPRVLSGDSGNADNLWVANPWVDMSLKSGAFCAVVIGLKIANVHAIIPRLANLRANDMVILYAIVVLLGMCVTAIMLGLTPALGALAAGVALGENRLTHQIDALVMPFREAFSSMFFISLGMLTDFSYVFSHPVVCLAALAGVILFKAFCAFLALKACGMDARGALAYGTSIAQIGELAFMILALAYSANAINEDAYHTMLFVSVASLVLTPTLVNVSMTKFGMSPETSNAAEKDESLTPELRDAIMKAKGHVVVIGAGHIGKRVADKLIEMKINVCLIDFNPVNLQPFKQDGIPVVAGDGADQNILRMAGINYADALFVMVPRDDLALQVVKSARDMQPTIPIVARSRYSLTTSQLKRAGANQVFCEEEEIANQLVDILRQYAENIKESKTTHVVV